VISDLNDKIQRLSTKLIQSEESKIELLSENNRLKEELDKLNDNLTKSKRLNSQLSDELERLRSSNQIDLSSNVNSSNTELVRLRIELENSQQENKRYQDIIQRYKSNIDDRGDILLIEFISFLFDCICYR
jgi:chromosome segregation ATPase